ncbi:serine/threonine-protein phosphatase [Cellulomonas sp. zg-ZUI199]|uniref:Serine/threonine-protein phosphatase n=1 Tax=Cellulomonas wangleii TaxID=2816956 RepID=A0ABX8DAN6_9CELL|nr:serine/threonine-protein phosphatase [Cellulomonas wangleii]QVI64143.1 serine/threonine-protein phosphatase [Cellulomonas wangleii]
MSPGTTHGRPCPGPRGRPPRLDPVTTPRPAPSGWVWRVLAGWAGGPQPLVGGALCLAAVLYAVAVLWRPAWFAPSGLLLLLLVGAFVLRWRALLVLVASVVLLTAALTAGGSVDPGQVVVLVLGCGAVVTFGVERERLGLQGAPGALMLVDLRDRLSAGGRLPALPGRWQADAEVRSAHGAAFSGDFVVAHRSGGSYEVVLVDVSGKGQAAGVRALQLQGALGGLLGALPADEFLPAANRYLLEQGWDEGFATAVHLALDLSTGRFRVASAGHPPPAVLHAGSGRIDVLDAAGGVALGILEDMRPGTVTGVLAPGDVVVLYTDGLIEAPGRDVDQGIDRLLGVVEAVVAARPGSAHEVLAGVRAAEDDDRAVVVVRRS